MDETLVFLPATELLELIASKQISPVELTKLYFRRIERIDPQLNSYLITMEDEALKTAVTAEQTIMKGEELGALHGLPISIKDTQMTKGVRTTTGSLVFQDRIPDKDSAVVERVRKAGAILLGKTNTPEFGLVGTCANNLGDHGRNPWNTEYTPGGSSGGAAAAMSACLCALSTGGDGGGSIRIPASFCGIYGIKPTQGRVSGYTGIQTPPILNIFGQQGPLSRTVKDSALLLQVMAGYDPRDPSSLREATPDFLAAVDQDIRGLRVAWSPDYGFANVDQEVNEVTQTAAKAFEDLGCHIETIDLRLESPYDAYGPIYETAAYASYGQYIKSHGEQLTEFSRFFIEAGSKISGADYARALGLIDRLRSQMDDVFTEYDLLLSPTLSVPGVRVGEFPAEIAGKPAYPHRYFGFHPFTYPINAIGHAAASIPAGFSSTGLPIGLHIVGKRGAETTVIAASAAFEKAKPWIHHNPPVS